MILLGADTPLWLGLLIERTLHRWDFSGTKYPLLFYFLIETRHWSQYNSWSIGKFRIRLNWPLFSLPMVEKNGISIDITSKDLMEYVAIVVSLIFIQNLHIYVFGICYWHVYSIQELEQLTVMFQRHMSKPSNIQLQRKYEWVIF